MADNGTFRSLNWDQDRFLPPLIDSFFGCCSIDEREAVSLGEICLLYHYYIETFGAHITESYKLLANECFNLLPEYMERLVELYNSHKLDPSDRVHVPKHWTGNLVVDQSRIQPTYGLRFGRPSKIPRYPVLISHVGNRFDSLSQDEFIKQLDSLPSVVDYIPPFARIYKSAQEGHVAVATRDIMAGEFVCEYVGSLVPRKEFFAREKAVYMNDEGTELQNYPAAAYGNIARGYVFDAYRLPDGTAIDIRKHVGAWLNSQDKAAESEIPTKERHILANSRVVLVGGVNSRAPRLLIRATKHISRSYELIQNYHNEWW